MPKSWRTALAMTAVLTGTYLTAPSQPVETGDVPMILTSRDGDRDPGPMHFALVGRSVKDLYPGAIKPMRLTVLNPYGFRIRLQRLGGKVATASRSGCAPTSANLDVRDYSGRLPIIVGPHQQVTLAGSIPVAMPRAATARCAGSHFTIVLSGSGSRVDR